MKLVRLCPICKEGNKELLFRQKFKEISEGSLLAGYDVVACQNCGFCFADNLPDQRVFDVYYREMSKYEHRDRLGQASEFEKRQFPAIAQFIQNHISEKQAQILEVGCANGGLLNALKQLGYKNILGIDPSPICARNAKQLYQIRVITSVLSEIQPEIGKFDFVILVAVLEHIQDLDNAITKLYSLLSPTGKLFIEVPDVTKFTASPDAPFQEFSIEHINYFSSISLANLMRSFRFLKKTSTQIFYDQTKTHTGYAIRMVFQRDMMGENSDFTKDIISAPALKNYISISQKVENRIHRTVKDLVDSQSPCIVWGVGTHTQRLMSTSELANANIIAFVDSNPNYQGKKMNNIPIISPGQLISTNATILVSSRIYQSEIVNQIRFDLKLTNKLVTFYED